MRRRRSAPRSRTAGTGDDDDGIGEEKAEHESALVANPVIGDQAQAAEAVPHGERQHRQGDYSGDKDGRDAIGDQLDGRL